MLYNLVNLDQEFSGMAQKSVGFTGIDLNTTNQSLQSTVDGGSAIDCIERMSVISPDVLNQSWLTQMYAEHSWLAFDLFKILLLVAVCGYIMRSVFDVSFGEQEAILINLLKRSLISTFMIAQGLYIIMALLLLCQEMCTTVAPGHVATELLVAGVTSPCGAVMIIAYTIGIFAEGIFYLIRFHLIHLSCILWIYAWLAWTFERTARHGVFALLFILVNIFLAFAMVVIWRVGAMCITHSSTPVTGWGGDVSGLVIMLIALMFPILTFFYLIFNPLPAVQRITYIAAKGV